MIGVNIYACLLCLLSATAPRLLVAPLAGGSGASAGMLTTLGESFAAEIRRQGSYHVLTHSELTALLSHDELSALLGCSSDTCFSAIGDAAGAAMLATGSVGRLGNSWFVTFKLMDVSAARVIASTDRRLQGGSDDDLLDQMTPMVAELFEQARRAGATGASTQTTLTTVQAAEPKQPASPKSTTSLPLATSKQPYDKELSSQELAWLSDGKGLYIGYAPASPHGGPVFAGNKQAVFLQRIFGGGRTGEQSWSFVFWEPRVAERWRAGVNYREGKASLRCGEHEIPLQPVEAKELARVSFYAPLWQRQAVHLARDDQGTFYYVDQAREPRGNTDFRLFVGTRGRLRHVELDDTIIDSNASLFISSQGRLILRQAEGATRATWAVGDSGRELVLMDLHAQVPMIYSSLGAYTGQPLGTPCDAYLR